VSAKAWPRIDGHLPGLPDYTWRADNDLGALADQAPHLCNVPDCTGPKLVARLEAADKLWRAVQSVGGEIDDASETDAAWERLAIRRNEYAHALNAHAATQKART
jgi:hypothetical protein